MLPIANYCDILWLFIPYWATKKWKNFV